MVRACVLFLFSLISFSYGTWFKWYPPKSEAIYPKLYVPDNGFSQFTTTKDENGWWFRDAYAWLKIGDTVYLWNNGQWQVPVKPLERPFLKNDLQYSGSAPSAAFAAPEQNAQDPCEISVSKVSGPGYVCKGQLLFEDNFNFGIENGKIWTPEIKFPGGPDFPFNVYLNDLSLHVRDGRLSIKPITLETIYGYDFVRQTLDITARCTGTIGTAECYRQAFGPQILPPIITSKIITKNKFAFKYGRVEISAKMPLGDWIYPTIQLEPRDFVYGVPNYASGLLRIATTKGNAEFAKRLYAGPIMCDSEPYRSKYLQEKLGSDLWSKEFHNYSVEWRPDGISLFVDGEKYGDVNPPSEGFYKTGADNSVAAAPQWLKGTVMAPFDELFYVSLGINVGGIHEFPDVVGKPWNNRATKAMLNFWNARYQWFSTWNDDTSALEVDYVRIYAL